MKTDIIEESGLQKMKKSSTLGFGKHFTDHMLTVLWSQSAGWGSPKIHPFGYLQMHPAAKVLHYATSVSH
jgi:branched-chain amino acid aminotransferase